MKRERGIERERRGFNQSVSLTRKRSSSETSIPYDSVRRIISRINCHSKYLRDATIRGDDDECSRGEGGLALGWMRILLFLDTTRLLALERIHKTEARFRPVTRCTAGRSWNKFRLNIVFTKIASTDGVDD